MANNNNVIHFPPFIAPVTAAPTNTLSDIIKDVDRKYQQLATHIEGFKQRDSQVDIIHDFATSIHHKQLLVAQAGTGIGKTLSYIVGALNYIENEDAQVVISTNTVALQTQLIDKDLPLFLNVLAPDITFEIAKGSGRYFCMSRAVQLTQKNSKMDKNSAEPDLFQTSQTSLTQEPDLIAVRNIISDFEQAKFNGDLDTLSDKYHPQLNNAINRDSNLCPGRMHCEHGDHCSYYIQRDKVSRADIVVTNHALLSLTLLNQHATLSNENGFENTVLIVDEAHKFPAVFRDASVLSFSLAQAQTWLMSPTRLINLCEKLGEHLDHISKVQLAKIKTLALDTRHSLQLMTSFLNNNFNNLCGDGSRYSQKDRWIMPPTEMPEALVSLLAKCNDDFNALSKILSAVHEIHIKANKKETAHLDKSQKKFSNEFTSLLKQFTNATKEATQCLNLYIEFANLNTSQGMIDCGIARWINLDNAQKGHFSLNANRLNIGDKFQESIVTQFKSVLLTSATLETLGSLDYFNNSLKIDPRQSQNNIKTYTSPFDYSFVNLHTPFNVIDTHSAKYVLTIVAQLSQIVARHQAVLVLFSSYKQLNETFNASPYFLQSIILRQQDHSKSELLRLHKTRIDDNRASILFGVDSLSEGVDLQKQYLTCVVIAKLPFLNLSEPMYKYESLCIKANGGDDFAELSLPICSQRLIQGVGRLIRSEEDTGEVFILDHRINVKRYGARLLENLPMYKPNAPVTYTKTAFAAPSVNKQSNTASKNVFSVKKWDEI
jgi:ATP-dependent DNA helicase DinG